MPTQKDNNPDPYLYASILGGFVHERNPIQAIVGDFSRMVKVIINMPKARKAAQTKIDQLREQMEYMESNIAKTHPKTTGHRIDRVR